MQITLIGNNRWQKTVFAVLIPALIFAALHKWSTMVRLILEICLFAYVVWRKRGNLYKSLISMPLFPVTAYVLYILISVLFSVNMRESAQSWVRLFEMYVITISVYNLLDTGNHVRTALFYILIAFGIAYIMDIDWYLRHLGGRWMWGAIYDNPINFDHHNTYSAICIMLMPVAMTFLFACKVLYIRIIMLGFLLMNFFLIYIFQSRTAQISLLFILFVTGFLLSTPKRKIIYLVILAAIMAMAIINIELINPRWLDENVRTAFGRTENWRNTISLIHEHPILGYGYGREIFRIVYLKTFGRQHFPGGCIKVHHAHGSHLDVLFANGIIGLAFFLSMSFGAFYSAFRGTIHRGENWLIARAVLVSLAGAYFFFLADIYDGVQWGLTWAFYAFAIRFWGRIEERESSQAKL